MLEKIAAARDLLQDLWGCTSVKWESLQMRRLVSFATPTVWTVYIFHSQRGLVGL